MFQMSPCSWLRRIAASTWFSRDSAFTSIASSSPSIALLKSTMRCRPGASSWSSRSSKRWSPTWVALTGFSASQPSSQRLERSANFASAGDIAAASVALAPSPEAVVAGALAQAARPAASKAVASRVLRMVGSGGANPQLSPATARRHRPLV